MATQTQVRDATMYIHHPVGFEETRQRQFLDSLATFGPADPRTARALEAWGAAKVGRDKMRYAIIARSA